MERNIIVTGEHDEVLAVIMGDGRVVEKDGMSVTAEPG